MAGVVPSLTEALGDAKKNLGEARWKEIQKLEPIVTRMMTGNTAERFSTAGEAMGALLEALPPALPVVVADWVNLAGQEYLERCQNLLTSNDDSWRSTSKIAIPASGFKIATRTATTDSPDAEPSISVRFETPRNTHGIVAWVAAGLLVFASAALVGVLLTRRTEPTVIPPVVQPTTIEIPAVVVMPEPTPTVASPAITQAAKPRVVWRIPPAPPATHAVPPASTPSVTAVDCDPPFYYEGSKKIFKPSCI